MPIDARIPLLAGQSQPDLIGDFGRVSQLKSLMDNASMRRMEFEQGQQDRAGAAARQSRIGELMRGAVGGDKQSLDDLAAEDFDAYSKLDERQRAAAAQRADAFVGIAQGLKSVPAAERSAALMQAAPILRDLGVDPDALGNVELSDRTLDVVIGQSLGAKGALERFRTDEGIRAKGVEAGLDRETDKFRHGLTLSQIAARAAEDRRTKATPSVADAVAGQSNLVNKGQIVETPDGPVLVDKATGMARPVMIDGKAIPGVAQQKKQGSAGRVIALVGQAEKLIDNATGSYAGAGVDALGRVFGSSTGGSRAIAKLRAIEGALLSEMPRMEGPQSNFDVQLYKQAAGQVGDPTIPSDEKRAALETLREIQSRYAGASIKSDADPLGIR